LNIWKFEDVFNCLLLADSNTNEFSNSNLLYQKAALFYEWSGFIMASVDLTPSPSLQKGEDRAQEIAECKVPLNCHIEVPFGKEPQRGKRDLG